MQLYRLSDVYYEERVLIIYTLNINYHFPRLTPDRNFILVFSNAKYDSFMKLILSKELWLPFITTKNHKQIFGKKHRSIYHEIDSTKHGLGIWNFTS